MSLRTRKRQTSRNNDQHNNNMMETLGRGHTTIGNDAKNEGNERTSKLLLLLVFIVVCLLGCIREYKRTYASSKKGAFQGNNNERSLLPRDDVVDPNFRSMLTAEEDVALDIAGDNTRYHLIFSTDCSPYQHWQSYLVYFSAMKVRQPGRVTRIASGCEDEDKVLMQRWFQKHIQGMSSRFHLHITPHFSGVKDEDGKVVGDYKFFNKPFGLKHWMEHAEQLSLHQTDDIVILIDPDMVLIRPLTGDFSNDRDTIIAPKRQPHILGRRVEHGLPFAQTYGFGVQWERFDLDRIAGPDSPAKLVDQLEGRLHYTVGPPYLATVQDMYQIALKWTEFVPLVHEQYPHLLAEMFAFCIAAAHLNLKHQIIDSLMVSDTQISGGEGWPLVDEIPNEKMCNLARNYLPNKEQYALPSVVHLCQRYSVGNDWFFGKRRFPTDFFDCEHPLLQEPPDNLATAFDFKKPPNTPDPKPLSPTMVNREAFMVCFLTAMANEASIFFKKQSCPSGTANMERSLKMVELFKEYRKEQA